MSKQKNPNSAKKASTVQTKDVLGFFDFSAPKTYRFKQVARELGLMTKQEKQWLLETVQALVESGKIKFKYPDTFQGIKKGGSESSGANSSKLVEGIVDHVHQRYAFVVVEAGVLDIKVASDDLKDALHGDKVKVEINKPARGNRNAEGRVLEVLQRGRDNFVGRIEISPRFAFVVPDSRKIHQDIFVPTQALNGAKHNEKVIVKITRYPENGKNPEGEVERVLGTSGEHQTEMHSIMAEFGLPFEFPPQVEADAEHIPTEISAKEISKRRDFRKVTTFTIDPDNAKDFDDALSVKFLDNGNFEIGVHIADVTYYVQEGTLLETEAYQRATSVYLVDRVIPMLPEKLSNQVCSLVPHEDRLTMSAVFVLNADGAILEEWFGRTVIHSDHRFTYEQAQEVIEGKNDLYKKEMDILQSLALKLREARFAHGAITFETIELKFKLEPDGTPIGMFAKERKDAHKLIEDFMLLANKRVAESIYQKKKGDDPPPMVYRVHAPPDSDRMKNFALFAKRFGYQVKVEGSGVAESLNQMVENLEGKDEQNILQNMAIRTMSKARYTSDPLGHFGLAFEHYSHFTSPIRRYPDMMAHRLLIHYQKEGSWPDKTYMEEQCKHSSEREKRAADAERASIKYKQVEYIRNYGKKVFDGIVSGMTDYGIFVEMSETHCEGMVRVADLQDDFYEFDEKNFRMVGKRSKRHINLGQKVVVKVKSTDLDRRTIDLTLINPREADDF